MQTPSSCSHHVVQVDEGVIDGHHLNFATLGGSTGDQTADTSESKLQERKISKEAHDS